MRLHSLVKCLREAASELPDEHRAPVVVLIRNADSAIDSETAWDQFRIVALDLDLDEPSVDLFAQADAGSAVMSIGDVLEAAADLGHDAQGYRVFVSARELTSTTGRTHIDAPAVAVNWGEEGFGVAVWFDGWERALDSESWSLA